MKLLLISLGVFLLCTTIVSAQVLECARMGLGEVSSISPSPLPMVEQNGTGTYTFTVTNYGPCAATTELTPGFLNVTITYMELADIVNLGNANTSVHGFLPYYDLAIYEASGQRQIAFRQAQDIPAGTTLTIVLDLVVTQNSIQSAPKNRANTNITPGGNHIVDDEDGNSTNDFTYTSATAPIELGDFYAEKLPSTSKLTWNTLSELNNEKFEIERSSNGIDFKKIGEVKGVGTSQFIQDYEFIDKSPIIGVNYYRLNQYDKNGYHQYSKTVQLTFSEGSDIAELKFKIYPNPTIHYLNVESNMLLRGHRVGVFDMLGRRLLNIPYVSGLEIPMNEFQSGLYALRIVNDIGVVVKSHLIVHQRD